MSKFFNVKKATKLAKNKIYVVMGKRRMPHKLESAYIHMIDYLKQQLAEKKEEVLHLVCARIKHKVFELSDYDGVTMSMDGIDLLEFLDQIEKGE